MQLAAALQGAKHFLHVFFWEKIAGSTADLFKLQYKAGLLVGVFNCSSTF